MGSSALSSCPALRPGIRPKRVLHLVVSALSRLRPPGSTVQAADPQTPIGLQSRLLLRLWPQELPCSTVASGLRNFLHSRPPQHAMPLGLRPRPPPTPPGQPEEGRLQKKLLRRTHGQRAPRHPSDRGYQMVHLHWHQHHTHPGWGQSVRWSLTALSDWHTRGLPIPSGRGGWVEVLSAVLKEARRPTSPD